MRTFTALATFLFFCSAVLTFAGTSDTWCRSGEGRLERSLGAYNVRLEPTKGEHAEDLCRGVVSETTGKEVFSVSEVGLAIDGITGSSVSNDGIKSVVLDGFSGGAHCCWTYWIVALGAQPKLIKEIRNQTGIAFERQPDGRVLLHTADGAFDYFDDLPHAFAPMPSVYLQLQGNGLHDVSAQFAPEYDKRIAEARQSLTAERINTFRAAQQSASASDEQLETKAQVLSIVLSYLYSGRDQQAWDALDEMWPAADRDRIVKLIVETRARGILAHISAGGR